eukprot:PhM_4_TR15897/c0_g1_i5/m.72136
MLSARRCVGRVVAVSLPWSVRGDGARWGFMAPPSVGRDRRNNASARWWGPPGVSGVSSRTPCCCSSTLLLLMLLRCGSDRGTGDDKNKVVVVDNDVIVLLVVVVPLVVTMLCLSLLLSWISVSFLFILFLLLLSSPSSSSSSLCSTARGATRSLCTPPSASISCAATSAGDGAWASGWAGSLEYVVGTTGGRSLGPADGDGVCNALSLSLLSSNSILRVSSSGVGVQGTSRRSLRFGSSTPVLLVGVCALPCGGGESANACDGAAPAVSLSVDSAGSGVVLYDGCSSKRRCRLLVLLWADKLTPVEDCSWAREGGPTEDFGALRCINQSKKK